jgi:hypothetical protein
MLTGRTVCVAATAVAAAAATSADAAAVAVTAAVAGTTAVVVTVAVGDAFVASVCAAVSAVADRVWVMAKWTGRTAQRR